MATPLSPMTPKSNQYETKNGNENWTFALVLAVWGLLHIDENILYKLSSYFTRFCRWLKEFIALLITPSLDRNNIERLNLILAGVLR